MKKEDSVYIKHILDAISAIESFSDGKDYQQLIKDKLFQDVLIRELEVIGEAAKHLSEEFKSEIADIPWKDIAGMRDRLIHYYFGIDLEEVWKTVLKDVPQLKFVLLKREHI